MKQKQNYCVIMAGGIGSRFWPMSTQQFPKQFQDILGVGKTMIQQTFERISKSILLENIFIITNIEYIDIIHKQIPNFPKNNIIGEPVPRNTAACNIYMANKISQIDSNANLIALPADHLILNESIFLEKVNIAFDFAQKNDYLITFGIQPNSPNTGYGYIKYSDNNKLLGKVKTFTEKPNLKTAQKFINAGGYLWNSGIFVWNVKSIRQAFKKHLPDMYKLFSRDFYNTEKEPILMKEIYSKTEQISIDNGILEKADNVYVIAADLGWSDLGTWSSIFENAQKDEFQNTKPKNVNIYNTQKSIIRIQDTEKLAIIDGLNDFIVIDTKKALLICPKSNDQLIKEYVTDLDKK